MMKPRTDGAVLVITLDLGGHHTGVPLIAKPFGLDDVPVALSRSHSV